MFLFFTACTKQENLNNEILTFKSREGLAFDYPLGWQILTMSDIDLIQPYKNSAEETFKTNVSELRAIEINFNQPHDIGPYDRTVDIAIQDFVFEISPKSAEEFIKKIESAWEQKGEVENYKSESEVDFLVWLGQSPVYELDLIIYVTQYVDSEGQKHFVEISRMGTDHEAIKDELAPVIDSLKGEP